MKTILIALGGNALIREHEIGNYKQQKQNFHLVAKQIAQLAKKGTKMIITHGNGPQVGNLQLQMHALKNLPEMPLEVDVAMTQGQIGFMIQNELRQLLPTKEISTIVTEALVDAKDPAFRTPSKPIGPYYKTKPKFSSIFVAGKGYRKMVASPFPKKILQLNSIKKLLDENSIVICCGGGGIPVVEKSKNKFNGIEAVIDKDLTSALLANELKADELVILTDVENVKLNFGKKNEVELKKIRVHELHHFLKEGEFGKGSMAPKVIAAIQFISRGGKKAVIASTKQLLQGIGGKSGTQITK